MKEDKFRDLAKGYLLPLLAGTKLGNAEPSSSHDNLVAYENPCSIFIKPLRKAPYRVRLERSQPFSPEENGLVRYFMEELTSILNQSGKPYFNDIMAALPRRVISKSLPGKRGRGTFEQAIQGFEEMASQSYEGHPVAAAIGMTGSIGHGQIRLKDMWLEDWTRVLSNGFDSMYVCGSDGLVFNLEYLNHPSKVLYAPYRLGSIAEWCNTDQRVAIVLNRSGEVLIFKNRALRFAKRRGAWRYYPHEAVVKRLVNGTKSLRRAVYESCLDVSFARTGGCVAILSRDGYSKRNEFLNQDDLFREKKLPRTKFLVSAVKVPFQRLDRRFRQELLSMDGATVLRHNGELLTAGAIVQVPGGSSGGGRTAAAKELSLHGLAIKISADGPLTGFRKGKEIFSL